MIGNFLGYFDKLFCKNCIGYFLGNFWKNTFNSNIWSHWFGPFFEIAYFHDVTAFLTAFVPKMVHETFPFSVPPANKL